MNPTAPTTGAPTIGSAPALDPTIVNLAQAIRHTETKGATDPYTAKGASGEFGAYQYTPDTWAKDVKTFTGKEVPLQSADKLIQNEVAYKKLESLKNQGYNVGQIASIWNSGSPDWQGKTGTNKFGVKYDVPKYVDSVAQTYQAIKAGQPLPDISNASTVGSQQTTTQQTNPVGDFVHNLETGTPFPASPNDGAAIGALKTAGNFLPSAFNFAKGIVHNLNPINTIKNLASIPGEVAGLVKDAGGAGNAAGAFASKLLPTAYNTLVPEAVKGAVQATKGAIEHPINTFTGGYNPDLDQGLARAQKAITNDPVGNIAPVIFATEGAAKGVDTLTEAAAKAKMADYVKNVADNTAKGNPIPTSTGTNLTGAFNSGISNLADRVIDPLQSVFGKSNVETPTVTTKATDTAGQILQGNTADAQLGAKVLLKIDTSGVKTYEDLSKTLDENIKSNLTKVDQEFAASPEPVKLNDLTKNIDGEVGGVKVKASINYVKESLSHLQELYKNTRDVLNEARIKALIEKAKKSGLTPTEINNLSREYGSEFGNKAFSARSGDPLTSVNARAYENVRSGLKDTARSLLKDDKAQMLDKNTSDMIRVKKLVDTMDEKVNKLTQRVTQRGVVEKLGRLLGKGVDMVTFGGPKAFIQKLFFPSNVGLKTLSSLDLEAQLSKNLQLMKSFEKADDTTIVNTLVNLLQKTNNLPNNPVIQKSVFGRSNDLVPR